jgi:creatine kinase/arginine kinase
MEYPKFSIKHKSLMSKHLKQEIFDKIKGLYSKNNFGLQNIINSGVINPDSDIGVYVGDEESYELFADLLNPIINEYHKFSDSSFHKTNMNFDELKIDNPDPQNKYILSTRIRVGRNLKNFPLGPAISKQQRLVIENIVSTALTSLKGELKGKYFSIKGMKKEDREYLILNHFLFKEGDKHQQAAGLNRDWPSGRGIYHNKNKTFLVWINEEDQLRIISMQKGANIGSVFKRLVVAVNSLESKMDFSFSDHLGYITSCPTNLGTAMRASVHIKLPKLAKNQKLFTKITEDNNLQIRGINGEHSQSEDCIFDISNKRRLGVTEVQCVKEMYNGVVALINAEEQIKINL